MREEFKIAAGSVGGAFAMLPFMSSHKDRIERLHPELANNPEAFTKYITSNEDLDKFPWTEVEAYSFGVTVTFALLLMAAGFSVAGVYKKIRGSN